MSEASVEYILSNLRNTHVWRHFFKVESGVVILEQFRATTATLNGEALSSIIQESGTDASVLMDRLDWTRNHMEQRNLATIQESYYKSREMVVARCSFC